MNGSNSLSVAEYQIKQASQVPTAVLSGSIQDLLRDIEVASAKRFSGLGLIAEEKLSDHIPQERVVEMIEANRMLVACDAQGVPVGFAALSLWSYGCLLEELDVLPEHGGKGLGRALVMAAIEWAKVNRQPAIFLSTFADVPWNRPFYSRLGFQIVPESELNVDMMQLRNNEIAAGLPVDRRVFMRMSL